MKQYKVLVSNADSINPYIDLENQVDSLWRDGFVCQGGVFATVIDSRLRLFQAMIYNNQGETK